MPCICNTYIVYVWMTSTITCLIWTCFLCNKERCLWVSLVVTCRDPNIYNFLDGKNSKRTILFHRTVHVESSYCVLTRVSLQTVELDPLFSHDWFRTFLSHVNYFFNDFLIFLRSFTTPIIIPKMLASRKSRPSLRTVEFDLPFGHYCFQMFLSHDNYFFKLFFFPILDFNMPINIPKSLARRKSRLSLRYNTIYHTMVRCQFWNITVIMIRKFHLTI